MREYVAREAHPPALHQKGTGPLSDDQLLSCSFRAQDRGTPEERVCHPLGGAVVYARSGHAPMSMSSNREAVREAAH